MDFEFGRDRLVDLSQEGHEVGAAVLTLALSDHLPVAVRAVRDRVTLFGKPPAPMRTTAAVGARPTSRRSRSSASAMSGWPRAGGPQWRCAGGRAID